MRKRWIWAVLLIALLLVAACRPPVEDVDPGSSEVTSTEELGACKPEEPCDDETAEPEAPVEETPEPAAPTEEPEREEEVENTPTEAAAVPVEDLLAVTDDDWVKGPDDAFITIIEYGDFQ